MKGKGQTSGKEARFDRLREREELTTLTVVRTGILDGKFPPHLRIR